MVVFKREISEVNDLLGVYIKERTIKNEINMPLEKMLKKANELNEKAFERFDRDFGNVTQERDTFNFIYYHIFRNLRLSFSKILDRLRDAKAKNLNPIVAKELKAFMKPLNTFINHIEKVNIDDISKTTELSESLESFRSEAEKYGFLCDLDEEIRYDKLSKDDFKKLLISIRDEDLEKDIDLNEEDLFSKNIHPRSGIKPKKINASYFFFS